MAQSLSLSAVTISGDGSGAHGSSWRRHFKLKKKTHILSGFDGQCFSHQCFSVRGHPNLLRGRNLRVEAGWLFKGGEERLCASSERSESANEDILIFFFQLDLATRVQVTQSGCF